MFSFENKIDTLNMNLRFNDTPQRHTNALRTSSLHNLLGAIFFSKYDSKDKHILLNQEESDC